MRAIMLVAAGGFLGTAARLTVTLGAFTAFAKLSGNPGWLLLSTLTVNVSGSLLLGYLAARGSRQNSSQQGQWLFWGVGCLGSYTTFSGFALDVWLGMVQGDWLLIFLYSVASVVFSIAAAGLGFYLATRHVRASC